MREIGRNRAAAGYDKGNSEMISVETAECIDRIQKAFSAMDELLDVCGKYQEQALAKRYALDVASVPLDSENRVFEIDDTKWIGDMRRLGMLTFMGLKIKTPNT